MNNKAPLTAKEGKRRATVLARKHALVVALALLVVMLSGYAAQRHLFAGPPLGASNGANYLWWYTPSVMFAAGKGFVSPPLPEVPGLQEFMEERTASFDAAPLKSMKFSGEPDSFQSCHRYLLYTVGAAFKIVGISWEAIKKFQVFIFAITVLLLFCCLAQYAHPALAFAGAMAYAVSPDVLDALKNIRDFSKTPFFFAVFWLLIALLQKPRRLLRYCLLAGTLGLAIGLGSGFRQDLTVCIFPTLLVLACAPLPENTSAGNRLKHRAAAIALMLVLFFAAAAPILNAMHRYGAMTGHQIIMGFGAHFDRAMGVEPASYERAASSMDNAASAARESYGRRVMRLEEPVAFRSPAAAKMARGLVIKQAMTFPRDMIVRFYGAALQVFQTPHYAGLALEYPWLARRSGLFCAGAALLLLAVRRFRIAMLLFMLAVFFGGYPSLEFEGRHAVHLFSLRILAAVFLLDSLLRYGFRLGKFFLSSTQRPALQGSLESTPRIALQLAAYCLCAAAIVSAPVFASHLWQSRQIGPLLQRYKAAKLASLPIERVVCEESILFRPAIWPAAPRPDLPDFRDHYLVAEFSGGVSALGFAYENDRGDWDTFRADMHPQLAAAGHSSTFRYFFPVYELAQNNGIGGWSRFAGIVLDNNESSRFRKLYFVKNPQDFPSFLYIAVPEDTSRFLGAQRLRLDTIFRPLAAPPYYRRPLLAGERAEEERSRGNLENAIHIYRAALNKDSRNAQLLFGLANALTARGDLAAAASARKQAIRLDPYLFGQETDNSEGK